MGNPSNTGANGAAGNSPKAARKVKALRVTARRDSFRRCGRKFGAEPVDIPLSELKKGEAETLKADKQLVVQEVEIAGDESAAEGEGPAAAT